MDTLIAIAALPAGRPLGQGAKLALCRLRLHAGADGVAYPSRETLARELGTSRRQVNVYLAELEQAGAITAEGRTGGTVTRWKLDPLFLAAAIETHRERMKKARAEQAERGKHGSHVSRGKDGSRVRGKDSSHHVGSMVPTETGIETGMIETKTPNPPEGAGEPLIESEDQEGKDALVQAQPPIVDPWTRLADPETIQTIIRRLTASDATPAHLAAWRAAARDLAARNADFEAVRGAINKRVNDEETKFAPKLPAANRLNAQWFLSLVQHYNTAGDR
ncbi:MAG: hypothetical protein GX595_17335 [Lentisphaerae bacterium]|nr:hypothetical protein [Lentisphaerota bacterium]